MDYLCTKFGNFSFSRFGFIVWTESQTHRLHTESHRGGWLLYSLDYRRREVIMVIDCSFTLLADLQWNILATPVQSSELSYHQLSADRPMLSGHHTNCDDVCLHRLQETSCCCYWCRNVDAVFTEFQLSFVAVFATILNFYSVQCTWWTILTVTV